MEQLDSGHYKCSFSLHSVVIGDNVAETRKDAKKGAAYQAVEFIESDRKRVEEICTCENLPTVPTEINRNDEIEKKPWLG
jgi:hypothetical protein